MHIEQIRIESLILTMRTLKHNPRMYPRVFIKTAKADTLKLAHGTLEHIPSVLAHVLVQFAGRYRLVVAQFAFESFACVRPHVYLSDDEWNNTISDMHTSFSILVLF